jgi:hypothetical protein
MWTQVSHGQLVDDILTKIGGGLNIEFERPSTAMVLGYRTGKWLYDEHGSRLDTKVSRWGIGTNRIVRGPVWTETYDGYRKRLERELCLAVNDLMNTAASS